MAKTRDTGPTKIRSMKDHVERFFFGVAGSGSNTGLMGRGALREAYESKKANPSSEISGPAKQKKRQPK